MTEVHFGIVFNRLEHVCGLDFMRLEHAANTDIEILETEKRKFRVIHLGKSAALQFPNAFFYMREVELLSDAVTLADRLVMETKSA